jgi:predicted N-acetyltransferase YhbS
MKPQVRAAQANDAAGIAELLVAEELSKLNDLKPRIDLGLSRSPDTCFVAVENGELIGVILASFNGFHLFVSHFAVARSHQRSGVGAELHQHLVERGRALGALGLITDSWLTSTGFYYRLGYRLPGAVFLIRDI